MEVWTIRIPVVIERTEVVLLGILGVLAVREHLRRRTSESAWLAATFGLLGALVSFAQFVPQEGHAPGTELGRRLVVAAILLFPYFLFRFMASFRAAPRAMTAGALQGERERCLSAGMDDYLTKPVRPSLLAATLKRWLRGAPRAAPGPETPESSGVVRGGSTLDEDMIRSLLALEAASGEELLRPLAAGFLEALPARVRALCAATRGGELREVARLAHALRGSGRQLGVRGLSNICEELERLVDTEPEAFRERAAELVPRLEVEELRTLAALGRLVGAPRTMTSQGAGHAEAV